MTRDREVNLGDLNEVTVDEPRANTSRAASGGNGKKAPPGGGKPAPKPQKLASSGGGNGGWMAACLVLVVLIAVLGVWFNKQVTGLQAQLDNRLTESSEKMGNLQSRLSATDESLNQSSGKLLDTVQSHGKKLEANEDEIRKLWDLSNKRNKAAIAEQKKALNTLSSSVKEVKKGQAGVDGKLKSISTDAAALKKQVESAVAAVNKSSDQWQSQIGQMQTRVEVLVQPCETAFDRVLEWLDASRGPVVVFAAVDALAHDGQCRYRRCCHRGAWTPFASVIPASVWQLCRQKPPLQAKPESCGNLDTHAYPRGFCI